VNFVELRTPKKTK